MVPLATLVALLIAGSGQPAAKPATQAAAGARQPAAQPSSDAGKKGSGSSTRGAAAGSAAPASPDALPPLPTGDVFPYAKKIQKLPNGLTVVMVPFEAGGLVAYDTLMRVGSRNEVEEKRTGYAHFFEHMMGRGTKKNPADKYNGAIKLMGIDGNAYTTDDYTLYYNVGPTASLPQLIDLEADRFQHLEYSREAFQTEAKAVLGEYNKDASRPEERIDEALHKAAFTTHTYRHTTIGFVEDIRGMTGGFDYSKQFFKRYYTPDNAIIFVAGDFEPDEVLPLIEKAYGGWKGRVSEAKPKQEPPQTSERTAAVDWPSETLPRLVLSYHTPQDDPSTKDGAVQQLLGPMLVGPASPLYKSLVLDKQVVDHMDVWYAGHRDPNLFTVVIAAKNRADLPAIHKDFDAAVANLADGKLDEPYLQAIKLNQIYSAIGGLSTAGEVAMSLAAETGPTGDPDGLDKLYQQMAGVTVQDVADFAKLYLVPEGRTVVTLDSKGGGK